MKILKLTFLTVTSLLFIQCQKKESQIVSQTYVDSLVTKYTIPKELTTNAKEIDFWKNRITDNAYDVVNKQKYAANLVARFHLLGDINDVIKADSLLLDIEKINIKPAQINSAF